MTWTNLGGQVRVGVRPAVTAQQLETATYLLDSYGGAAAAYSLRKLNSTYVGSAIRVRRSGDNVEGNIGFDASGNLDTTALTTFVGVNNTALYSEEFDNVWWNKFNVTVTANQSIAPDGTMTADLLSETTTANNHSMQNVTTISFPSGTSWNMSVYVKKGPGTSAPNTFVLAFDGGNILNKPYTLFNILTGVVVETGNASNDLNFGSSITDVGNGWWRCSMWGTTNTLQLSRVTVGAIRFNANLNTLTTAYYTGNVQANVYIWGWQFVRDLNNTSVLTTQSYTKTTANAGGNGFVTTWYDQSGNGRNAAQSTAASQPKIVVNGILNSLGDKPAINFDGSGDSLNSPYNQGSTNEMYLVTQTSDTYFVYPTHGLGTYGYVAQNGSWSTLLHSGYGTPQLFTNGVLKTPVNRTDVYNILNGYKLVNHKNFSMSGWSPYPMILGVYNGSSADYNGNVHEWLIYPTLQASQSQIESNINTYYSLWDSSIVQSGLVMNLDAGFKSSYLGTGSTWYDISGSSNNNGTLYNSPVSGTSSITFNGSNNYFTNGIAISDTMNTIDIWVKMKSTANVPIIYYGSDQFQSTQWTWGMGVYVAHSFSEGPMSYPTSALYTESVTLNVWKNFTMVRNDNGSVKLYKNGVLVGTKAGSGTTSVRVSTDRLYIAKAGSSYGNFDMGSAKIYNRALSASEILQNFNATKSRFGL